jgi:hypothetical protein
LRNGGFVGTEIKPGAQRQREVRTVSGNAVAGKHPADRDRAEIREQIDQEVAVHVTQHHCERNEATQSLSMFEISGLVRSARNDGLLVEAAPRRPPSRA